MTFGISVMDGILSITDFHFCFYVPPFYTKVMYCDDANEIAMDRAIKNIYQSKICVGPIVDLYDLL